MIVEDVISEVTQFEITSLSTDAISEVRTSLTCVCTVCLCVCLELLLYTVYIAYHLDGLKN